MSTTLTNRFLFARKAHALLHFLHLDLMLAGLLAGFALTNLVIHRVELVASFNAALPTQSTLVELETADDPLHPKLTPPMRAALDSVARRYRVSNQALLPIFEAAQVAGRERNIDPVLLIAVISVESSFNPYSQSVMGAQGLMQVIPRFHQDKIPEWAGAQPFLDPVSNVHIGAHVLQEAIRRQGSLMLGLQQYAGALDDDAMGYANKVVAEKQRLVQFVRRENSA
ncbi:MAG: transglycosylase SLT domain-containing protein [Rhodocyclaceae bacterium]|nr:transglycosylase SLT domain-containing protein [Rhodocyclaceae bacterium]